MLASGIAVDSATTTKSDADADDEEGEKWKVVCKFDENTLFCATVMSSPLEVRQKKI